MNIHVFEKAGLGKAPFRFVRVERRVGPIVTTIAPGITAMVGAPGQPMGSCAYCGTGIAECCVIHSADGREFIVGNECVRKTGDGGLRRELNAARTKLRHEREDQAIADGRAFVDEHAEQLRAIQTPSGRGSMFDRAAWFFANAGRAGKLQVIRECRKAVAS